MTLQISPTEFEKQIKRIHDILLQEYGTTVWNDKIPDPDNPEQNRQIDISVRFNNKLMLIECRHHKKRQDVKWIEELKGRKDSLNADEIIAVSSSGFTEGAIKKANRFGIYLCSLVIKDINTAKATIEEPTIINFQYKQFSNLKIGFILGQSHFESNKVTNSFKVQKKLHHKIFYKLGYLLGEQIHYKFYFDNNANRKFYFSEKIDYPNLVLAGTKIEGFLIEGEFCLISKEIPSPQMFVFNQLNENENLIATVERQDIGGIEIIKTISKFSSVKLETSIIPMPPSNSIVSGVIFNKLPGNRVHPPKPTIIGNHELPFRLSCDKYFFAVPEKALNS